MTRAGGGGGGGGRAASAAAHYVDGSAQQDAQEYLQKLLEAINGELVALEADLTRQQQQQPQQQQQQRDANARRGERQGKSAATADDAADMRGWTIVQGRRETASVREHVSDEGRSLLLAAVLGGATESQLRGASRRRTHTSVLVEHFYTLPVDVGFAAECTIEEALQRSCGSERVYDDGHNRELHKTVLLRRLPRLLLLHLRRWAVTAEGELVKLSNRVRYGRTLVLPSSVCASDDGDGDHARAAGSADATARAARRARTYRRLSVVAHRGEATGRGHYVTYLVRHAASPLHLSSTAAPSSSSSSSQQQHQQHAACGARAPSEAMVVLCNDASVTLCRASEMQADTAYFLVYQRV